VGIQLPLLYGTPWPYLSAVMPNDLSYLFASTHASRTQRAEGEKENSAGNRTRRAARRTGDAQRNADVGRLPSATFLAHASRRG